MRGPFGEPTLFGDGESQTITFNALPDQAFGTAPFTISATSSSGLTVSFTSTTCSVCTVSGAIRYEGHW